MLVSAFREKEIAIEKDLRGINYRYIDGKMKNRKHCSGYCNFHMHRGFMNDKQIQQHRCYEKECDFFFTAIDEMYSEKKQKKREKKQEKKREEQLTQDILKKCNDLTSEFEGLRATSVKEENGTWIIEYITICSVDLDAFENKLSEFIGDFQMIRKECDYETMVNIYIEN